MQVNLTVPNAEGGRQYLSRQDESKRHLLRCDHLFFALLVSFWRAA